MPPMPLWFLLAALFPAGAQPQQDATPSDWQAIRGTWQPLRAAEQGFGIGGAASETWEFQQGKAVYRYVPKFSGTGKCYAREAVCRLDAAKDPKWIDITFPDEGMGGKTLRGIYLLRGDVLVICLVRGRQARPDDFTTPANSGRELLFLQRSVAAPAQRPGH